MPRLALGKSQAFLGNRLANGHQFGFRLARISIASAEKPFNTRRGMPEGADTLFVLREKKFRYARLFGFTRPMSMTANSARFRMRADHHASRGRIRAPTAL